MTIKLTTKVLQELPLRSLLNFFKEAAILHGEYYYRGGDYKKVNAQYDRLSRVYSEIRSRGPDAQKLFLDLLDHDSIGLQIWVAMYALEFAPELAESKLNEIARSNAGLASLDAKIVLEEWKAGSLKFV